MTPERWQQIEQLYHEALECPLNERAGWLASACGEDAELRREIELLLTANNQAEGFLTAPALQLAAQSLAADEKPTQPLNPASGMQLKHYKILSRIGAGGMGEVYLARDTKLERRVALKLLPLKFTQEPERLQRFIREAKTASALNHPNIITIYEIGVVESERGQTHFIATEYIEGDTLREWKLEDEDQRLRQTLDFVIQIASALDAAHRSGIVHRDIKPENLMVRPDGLVKVLDFGLAKLTATTSSSDNQIDTDAQTTPAEMQTVPGMILGTLRYMSPEQARGRVLDARTDIFSLGVVLYELLTGKPLFEGETTADVIAAIIHKETPGLSDYLPAAPAELERILRKALAKDCRNRYQTARDLQIDLQALKQESELSARLARSGPTRAQPSDSSAAQTVLLTAPRFSFKQAMWVLPVVALLGGALWWWLVERGRPVEAPPPASLKTAEVFTWQSAIGEVNSLGSFSPDGKWVAFTSFKGGTSSVWVKQAAAGGAEQSTKDEFYNRNPIWSPNGEELAYVSLRPKQPGIWRKPPLGNTPTLLKALAGNELGIQLRAWSRNGTTLYYEVNHNLYALALSTGAAKQLTNFTAAQVVQNTISISPDELHIAYGGSLGQEEAIFTLPVSGGAPKRVAKLAARASKTVWHPDSNRIFFSASSGGASQIFVADRAGHQAVQLTFGDQDIRVLDVSADGTKVLYGSSLEESDLWGVQVAKGEEFAVASEIGFESWPDVSPTRPLVAYQSVRNFNQANNPYQSSILTKSLGSADRPVVLAKEAILPKWAPDGVRLAFSRQQGSEGSLWTINVSSGEEKKLVSGDLAAIGAVPLPYNRMHPTNFDWSPDSGKLVYSKSTNGLFNLWVVAADGSNNAQATNHSEPGVNTDSPFWSADGKRVAYLIQSPKTVAGLWVTDTGTKNSRAALLESGFLRLLGWSQRDKELVVAKRSSSIGNMFLSEISLLRVSVVTGEQKMIAVLPQIYLHNIYLSADKQTIAYVARQDGKDNVWVLPVVGGVPKKLTSNNDPQLYLSSLAWSPDGRAIFFGKQTKHNLIAMLTNFE